MNPYPPKPIQDFPSWPGYFKVDGINYSQYQYAQ